MRSITICCIIRIRRHLHVLTSHKDNAYTINHVHEFPGVWLSKLLQWYIKSHLCGIRDTENTHRCTDAQMNTIIKQCIVVYCQSIAYRHTTYTI